MKPRVRPLALAALLLLPSSAQADIIHLSNGKKLEGTIRELHPEDSLVLRDATGNDRRIPWTDLESIERTPPKPTQPTPVAPTPVSPTPSPPAPAPAPAPDPSPPAPPSPAPPSPAPPSAVLVHAKGAPGTVLERQDERGTFHLACRVPCDFTTPSDGLYRISGAGLRPSKPFRLTPDGQGALSLHVTPASELAHGTGFALTLAGSAAFALGGFIAYVGLLESSSYTSRSKGSGLISGGLLMMAGGGLAGVVGVPLLLSNDATEVRQHASPARRPVEADARTPSVVTPEGLAFALPLASGVF